LNKRTLEVFVKAWLKRVTFATPLELSSLEAQRPTPSWPAGCLFVRFANIGHQLGRSELGCAPSSQILEERPANAVDILETSLLVKKTPPPQVKETVPRKSGPDAAALAVAAATAQLYRWDIRVRFLQRKISMLC
jgi:hypothetical protein